MLLHELLRSRREEVLEACSAERHHPQGLDQLARYITDYFDDIVRLLTPDSASLAPLPVLRTAVAAPIVGASPAMARVRLGIDQLAHRSRTAVLISGDRGTGRRHCAMALHAVTFPEGEFFEFDPNTDLAELEKRVADLRSHVATAPGLTVYLPNVTDVTGEVQRYLADLLQIPLLQCRLIASSSDGVGKISSDARLRPYLASAFSSKLLLPPLRARRGDIALLATHFAEQLAARGGTPPLEFSVTAIDAMQGHAWPGNVADLANVVEQLWQQLGSGVVEKDDLPTLGDQAASLSFNLPPTGIVFADLERVVLAQALAMTGNNQSRAAILLGMTRDQLRYRMAKFEIVGAGVRGSSRGKNR
jgi:DNA-binding NtrC family response regulator